MEVPVAPSFEIHLTHEAMDDQVFYRFEKVVFQGIEYPIESENALGAAGVFDGPILIFAKEKTSGDVTSSKNVTVRYDGPNLDIR